MALTSCCVPKVSPRATMPLVTSRPSVAVKCQAEDRMKQAHDMDHKDVNREFKKADSSDANATIFDKIGGKDAMLSAVDKFYDRVLADDRVNHFFKDVDMKKQRAKQMKFMMYAFGGPNEYQGRDMYKAHHNMYLTQEHFDAIVENFGATLDELQVPPEVQQEVVQVVLGTREDIINH